MYRFTKFGNGRLYFVEKINSTATFVIECGVMIKARRSYKDYCIQYNSPYGDCVGVFKIDTFKIMEGIDFMVLDS